MRHSLLTMCLVGCGYSSYYPDLPDHLFETGAEPVEPFTGPIPCSAPEGQPLTLTVGSRVDQPLQLSMVTADTCAEQLYLTLTPGQTVTFDTTDNWVWTIRDGGNVLLAVFQAPSGASSWYQIVP